MCNTIVQSPLCETPEKEIKEVPAKGFRRDFRITELKIKEQRSDGDSQRGAAVASAHSLI